MAHRKRGLLTFVVLVVCIQSFPTGDLLATTKFGVSFNCPVCAGKVTGYDFASTNTFGGQDRDFCTRAAGDQPLLLLPNTCPQCLYSGYARDFAADVNVPENVKSRILAERVLKPFASIEKGVPSERIPAHVRYDLMAQTYQLRGQENAFIAGLFLRASWAVRLEPALPPAILGEELVKKVGDWKTTQWRQDEGARRENHAVYEVHRGRQYREVAKSLEGEPRLITLVAAVSDLRSHGENTEALEALSMLQSLLPDPQYVELDRFLRESVARERYFQSKAVSLFEKIVDTQEGRKEQASTMYLCGELHRRLENWKQAEACYAKCLETADGPKWLAEWASEQRSLLPR